MATQRMSFRHNTYDSIDNNNLGRNSNRHSFSGFHQIQQHKQKMMNNSRRSSFIQGKAQNSLNNGLYK